MRKVLYLLLLTLPFHVHTQTQKEATTKEGNLVVLFDDGTWEYADSIPLYNINPAKVDKLEIPKLKPKENITTHLGYCLSYNESHEQADWVAYVLTKEETVSKYDRTGKFLPDPLIKTGTANDLDYKNSGFDRGHLAPAGDMGWSGIAMAESFYYSNMSPQDPGFNRGIWKKLEEQVRTWASDYDSLYIVTGPVLQKGLPSIGKDKVSIPRYFYKVILDYTQPGIKAIGFIIPNQKETSDLESFAVSVDSVENFTGIDFFPRLPDDQESIIEQTVKVNDWTWGNRKTGDQEKLTSSVQCKGITKAGTQCKNKTLNPSGYCYLHESQAKTGTLNEVESIVVEENQSSSSSIQCKGTTKAGARCKNMTTNSNGYCYLHQDQASGSTSTQSTIKSKSTTTTGKTIYTGPRGGKYYYSKSGKKVYVK